MSRGSLVLVASLIANAGLVGYLATRQPAEPGKQSVVGAAPERPAVSGGETISSAEKHSPRSPASPAASEKWKQLVEGDLHALVTQLRASGFSETQIAGVVRRLLDEKFGERMKEIYGITGELAPFWQAGASRGAMNLAMNTPEKREALEALRRERTQLERELLGDTASAAAMNPQMLVVLRSQYGELPEDKLLKIQSENMRISQAQSEFLTSRGGQISVADRETMLGFNKMREDAIAAILTPEEFAAYQLRSSPTASMLRNELVAFNPTEEEYKAIYNLRRAFEQEYPAGGAFSPDAARARTQATAVLQTEIAAALGPERGADYKLATEPGSMQVSRLVARLELPLSTIPQLLSVQRETQSRAAAARNDRTLTAETRAQVIGGLQTEALAKVGTILGPRALDAYKQAGGGWIDALDPAAAAAARGAARGPGAVQIR